jgi:hypothetical protein
MTVVIMQIVIIMTVVIIIIVVVVVVVVVDVVVVVVAVVGRLLFVKALADAAAWGDRYFERQEQAMCGRHAVNNVLGGPQFVDGVLERACTEVVAQTGEEDSAHQHAGGWCSRSVLAAAMDLTAVLHRRMLDTPVFSGSYHLLLNTSGIFGAVVNQGNVHWSAVAKHASKLWHVDSQRLPISLTETSFTQLLHQHPMTFLVVAN